MALVEYSLDGNKYVYDYGNRYEIVTTSGVNSFTWNGDNMANSTPGLYGDLLFNHEFSYQPYTVKNIKTGKVLGKVYEVNPNSINGLGSGNSLYSVLDANDKVTYPLYSWSALLEKLQG